MMNNIYRTLAAVFGEAFLSDLRKHYIGRRFVRGKYDKFEKEMEILDIFVHPQDITLDIGANIGIFTKRLSALVGNEGRVFSFEPLPITYGYLTHNIMVGGYKNVVPCGAALGDKTGVVDILLPEEGRRNIYLAKLDHDKRERGIRFSVLCFRIDDLYSSGCLDRVDFIKCDVEGAELLVFQGARDTIMTFKPAVICEIGGGCKSFGYTSEDLFGWFRKHGYSSFYYDGNKLVPCDGINNMNSNSNYIFLTSQRYAKIIQHKPNLAIKIG